MTITLSQADYQELIEPSETAAKTADNSDLIYSFPSQLGEGYCRWVPLSDGLDLLIEDYRLKDDLVVEQSDRTHPVEYVFEQIGCAGMQTERYYLYGHGLAPAEQWHTAGGERIFQVNVHIKPEIFQQWIGNPDSLPVHLRALMRSPEQKYHEHIGTPVVAMQIALQQILNCPYQGFTRRLYLESKLWELMTLILADYSSDPSKSKAQSLKSEDVERIHYAGEILRSHLANPPSLMGLARQVQINDHKLKIGFKEIFGTTVFGYLHDCRMEQARQLLETGELSVGRAAQAVGFANRSHFAVGFRKKFGINPGLYRKHKQTYFPEG